MPAQVVVPTDVRAVSVRVLDDATRRQLEPILRAGYQQVLRERVRGGDRCTDGAHLAAQQSGCWGCRRVSVAAARGTATQPELVSHLALIANDLPAGWASCSSFGGGVSITEDDVRQGFERALAGFAAHSRSMRCQRARSGCCTSAQPQACAGWRVSLELRQGARGTDAGRGSRQNTTKCALLAQGARLWSPAARRPSSARSPK